MYYVNKIVGWSLSPLGIFFLGLLAGMLLRRVKTFRAWGTAIVVVSVVQLWVLSCGISLRLIGLPLEGDEIDERTLPQADAIVLLGGGMGYHAQCGRPEMFSSADRVWTAAKLWKAGKAPLMTVSGSGAKGELAFLRDMGVDEQKVRILEEARNTEEEARLISSLGIRKILLVTSAWHMPRAKMLFERAGFEVVAAPSDYEMHFAAEFPVKVGDFVPNAESLEHNSYVVKEWVARFCYGIKRR